MDRPKRQAKKARGQAKPKVFDLPEGNARETLAEAVRILEAVGIGREVLVLSGGTNLAARWRTRESDDIDLVASLGDSGVPEIAKGGDASQTGTAGGLGVSEDRWTEEMALLSSRLRRMGARNFSFIRNGILWEMLLPRSSGSSGRAAVGKASLFVEVPPHPLVDGAVESSHGIRLEDPAWTLQKKIRFRMYERAVLFVRDAYDILVATERAPRALDKAMKSAGRDAIEDIMENLGEKLEDPEWTGDGHEPWQREIVSPRYPELTGRRLWERLLGFLEEQLQARAAEPRSRGERNKNQER